MIPESIIFTLNTVKPMLIIVTVILLSIRVTQIVKNNSKFNLFNEAVIYLFIVYVLFLFNMVLLTDNNDFATNNFTLFKEITRYTVGSDLFYKNVVGNVIIFFPYGIFISYFTKARNIVLPLLLSFILSVSIELTQLIIAGRVFDIDDIVLNIIGALLGYLFYRLSRFIFSKFHKDLTKKIITVIVVILCILSTLYIYSAF